MFSETAQSIEDGIRRYFDESQPLAESLQRVRYQCESDEGGGFDDVIGAPLSWFEEVADELSAEQEDGEEPIMFESALRAAIAALAARAIQLEEAMIADLIPPAPMHPSVERVQAALRSLRGDEKCEDAVRAFIEACAPGKEEWLDEALFGESPDLDEAMDGIAFDFGEIPPLGGF